MNLHQDQTLFEQAITATAQHFDLPAIYIEKDYWVTLALHEIFNSEMADYTVFKGGTALSKCYGFIERFSEDIDLALIRDGNETDSALKRNLKKITSVVNSVLPEVNKEGITRKLSMIRKTAHEYNPVFSGDYGQVRQNIIVEATWLGNFEPYIESETSCFITEFLMTQNQDSLITQFGLAPFTVKVLSSERTLCEKIMSLVRFSHTENPIEDLNNKIRHTYDLYQMLNHQELSDFLDSDEFEKMLLKVKEDDIRSYKNHSNWLENHPKDALIFSDTEETWKQMKTTYKTNFSRLVYGDLPNEEDIEATLNLISKRLESIRWI